MSKTTQPTLQFDEQEDEKAIAEISEAPVCPDPGNDMMPRIVEATEETPTVKLLSKITVDKLNTDKVFYEISSASDQIPIIEFDLHEPEIPEKPSITVPEKVISILNKEAGNNHPSSGGYLAKPAQIYVEEKPELESKSVDQPLPLHIPLREDEPVIEMHLVVKSIQAAEEQPKDQQIQPIMISNVEEPALQDETEDLRRRAMERIAKLRNLSFNANASDSNNEFETVPAYLRRNMELHNSIADVESFYSNYSVKTDEHNNTEISTINTFLDGKKPD